MNLFILGHFDEDTKMLLINALYFKSTWKVPFETELTQEKKFYNSNGEINYIPTMLKTFQVPHGSIESLNSKLIKMKYMVYMSCTISIP